MAKAEKVEKKEVVANDKVVKKDDKDVQILEMQEQMKKMQGLIESMTTAKTHTVQPSKKISLEVDIPVISLTIGQLNISTEGFGKGDTFKFDNFGDIIDIPMGDLKECVRNNKSFFNEGNLYILDEDAVKELRLSSKYKTLLTEEILTDILKQDVNKIVETYSMASDAQKEIIIQMIVDKKLNKDQIDANVLLRLGEICGRDLLNIENPLDIPLEGEK